MEPIQAVTLGGDIESGARRHQAAKTPFWLPHADTLFGVQPKENSLIGAEVDTAIGGDYAPDIAELAGSCRYLVRQGMVLGGASGARLQIAEVSLCPDEDAARSVYSEGSGNQVVTYRNPSPGYPVVFQHAIGVGDIDNAPPVLNYCPILGRGVVALRGEVPNQGRAGLIAPGETCLAHASHG